ncbi:MAG: hypothetical protein KKH74_01795 [Gammaproteobacteria bacterium]|nr:hypothetical protein [Gammaproteobacteria bacterium]MBU1731024.1 hypothetical protein [Gammaproteobacteria bacterium]MBU1893684.1 hypothetical protein [Gammaproteobacteria bacterium]
MPDRKDEKKTVSPFALHFYTIFGDEIRAAFDKLAASQKARPKLKAVPPPKKQT